MLIRLAIYFVFTIISMLLVWLTVFIDGETVTNINQLNHVELGWPIHFLEQDQSAWEPPLPYRATYKINKTLSRTNGFHYVLSVIIVDALLIGIYSLWRRRR